MLAIHLSYDDFRHVVQAEDGAAVFSYSEKDIFQAFAQLRYFPTPIICNSTQKPEGFDDDFPASVRMLSAISA